MFHQKSVNVLQKQNKQVKNHQKNLKLNLQPNLKQKQTRTRIRIMIVMIMMMTVINNRLQTKYQHDRDVVIDLHQKQMIARQITKQKPKLKLHQKNQQKLNLKIKLNQKHWIVMMIKVKNKLLF